MDERILVGGNHLANALLGMGIFPAEERNTEHWAFVEKYGNLASDIWVAWKAIMDVRDGLPIKTDHKRETNNLASQTEETKHGGH